MASVFDFMLFGWCPRWTSIPNWVKDFGMEVVLLMRSSFVRKINVSIVKFK